MSSPSVDSFSPDNNDFPYLIEAFMANKGFGEMEDSKYFLKPYEALYLVYTKRLILKSKRSSLDFDSLIELILRDDKDILTKFLIYRDLRSRGYIAREGFGFGVDFRVYERGDFEKKPSKYIVFGLNEGINMKANIFSTVIEQIGKMGKEGVIAVVERRGGVIYYKVAKTRFIEKKLVAKNNDNNNLNC